MRMGAITTGSMKKYLQTKIISAQEVAPGYTLLQFESEVALLGEPGQFVMVRGKWGTNPVLPRAFSIVKAGNQGEILVRDVGPGTSLLCRLKPGDDLAVLGPLGKGYSPLQKKTAVMVAGGVGVAPLVYLTEQLHAQGVQVVFLYGARTRDDLPLASRIEKIAKLIVTTEDGSVGQKGRVTTPLEEVFKDSDIQVFSCGPNPMLEAVGKLAIQSGVTCEVAMESPMACGMGTCKGCAVVLPNGGFRYVCTDGPVFNAVTLYGGVQ